MRIFALQRLKKNLSKLQTEQLHARDMNLIRGVFNRRIKEQSRERNNFVHDYKHSKIIQVLFNQDASK